MFVCLGCVIIGVIERVCDWRGCDERVSERGGM